MAGFDNGTTQGGVYAQANQMASIMRGSGPPVPQSGVVGSLYIDIVAWVLYTKRSNDSGGDVDPWGHYVFAVPATYQPQLKWFGTMPPTNDIGVNGDYYLLWGAFGNYGLNPLSIYGPKAAGAWPGAASAVAVTLNPLYTAEDEDAISMPALTTIPIQFAPSANGDNQLVAGVANQTIKVYQMELSFGAAVSAAFWSNPAATNHRLSGVYNMFAGGSITLPPTASPWFTTQPGETLNLNTNAAVNVGGVLGYVQS